MDDIDEWRTSDSRNQPRPNWFQSTYQLSSNKQSNQANNGSRSLFAKEPEWRTGHAGTAEDFGYVGKFYTESDSDDDSDDVDEETDLFRR